MKWWKSVFVPVAIIAVTHGVGFLLWKSEQAEDARRSRTKVDFYNLKNAMLAFHAEYREYPLLNPAYDLTIDSEHPLMDILLGSDKEKSPNRRNPRGIQFYAGRAAKSTAEGRFKDGVSIDENGDGELWDPWGNHYRVRLDTNYDGKIENPETPGKRIPESIAVWSAGPDGDFATWKDNVKSW